jgi:hypothetical protein
MAPTPIPASRQSEFQSVPVLVQGVVQLGPVSEAAFDIRADSETDPHRARFTGFLRGRWVADRYPEEHQEQPESH